MLLTLVRDNGSAASANAGGGSEDSALPAPDGSLGPRPKYFTVEVPYTPQGASLLAQVLVSWRMARPGRAVFLILPNEPEIEIGSLSASRIEWMLPVVERIAVIDQRPASAADPEAPAPEAPTAQ